MDKRFAAIHNDPRFARKRTKDKRTPKSVEKNDPRFAALNTDTDFKKFGDESTDKYGRRKITKKKKKKPSTNTGKNKNGDDDEEGSSSSDDTTTTTKTKKNKKRGHEDAEERMERLNRMARGEANDSDFSGSSSSDSDDGEDKYEDVASSSGSDDFSDGNEDDQFFQDAEKELDARGSSDIEIKEDEEKIYNENLRVHEAVLTGEETKRLAVVNLDWDRVRAVDLHALLQSFLSGAGTVTKVTIYPSEYGLKMMAQDEQFGPRGIYTAAVATVAAVAAGTASNDKEAAKNLHEDSSASEKDDDEDDNTSGDGDGVGVGVGDGQVDEEKLRLYEMQKLRYYFGVIECNSAQTATSLYNQCDGIEYESSSLVLDLRYIPDDIQFKHVVARTASTHIPESYKPPEYFYSHALQQTNVKLTWDEPEIERKALSSWSNNRNSDTNAFAEQDLRTYLAEASEESELEEERWSDDDGNDDDDDDLRFSDKEKDAEEDTNMSEKEKKKLRKEKKKRKKKRKKEKKAKKKKRKDKYLATFGMDQDEEGRSMTGGLIPDDEYEGLEIKFSSGFGDKDYDEDEQEKELRQKFSKKGKDKNEGLSVFGRYQVEKKQRRKDRRKARAIKIAAGEDVTGFEKEGEDQEGDNFFLGEKNMKMFLGGKTSKKHDDYDHMEGEEDRETRKKQEASKAKAELDLLMIPEKYGDARDTLTMKLNAKNDVTYKKMIQQEKRSKKKGKQD